MVTERNELKERSLYVYLPSVELAKDWKTRAERQGQSISKFTIEHVLSSLRQEEEEEDEEEENTNVSKAELAKKLREREEELRKVRQECKMYRQLAEKLDNDLKYYRAQPFLEGEEFQGVRQYDRELVDLFKRRPMVDSDRLFDELNIDPREIERVRAIKVQLESLQVYGLIQTTPRGWKWVG